MTRGLAVVLFSWTVACGGATAGGGDASVVDDAAMDAATFANGDDARLGDDDASSDAGTFACGDALCAPSQICLTPAYGCLSVALPDSAECPVGTEPVGASCLPPNPPPSCVSPAPGTGSFDCSSGDAGAACSVVNAPIPSGCSQFCRANCA